MLTTPLLDIAYADEGPRDGVADLVLEHLPAG